MLCTLALDVITVFTEDHLQGMATLCFQGPDPTSVGAFSFNEVIALTQETLMSNDIMLTLDFNPLHGLLS